MTSKLVTRVDVTNATRLKYLKKPLDWGDADCLHMVRSHVVKFGHALPKIPRYNSPTSAIRALKKAGFDDLGDVMDSILPRTSPSSALVGDVMLMEGNNGLDALVILVGGGNVMGWHEDAGGLVTIIPTEIKAAWSVLL